MLVNCLDSGDGGSSGRTTMSVRVCANSTNTDAVGLTTTGAHIRKNSRRRRLDRDERQKWTLLFGRVVDYGFNLFDVFLREFQYSLQDRQVGRGKRIDETSLARFSLVASLEHDVSKVSTGISLVQKHRSRNVAEPKGLFRRFWILVGHRRKEGDKTLSLCRFAKTSASSGHVAANQLLAASF